MTTVSERSVPHEVEVFFDGECPLCRREIEFLRRRDRRSAIRFTDIATSDFDAAAMGMTQQRLMDRIHGRLPSGEIIEGVEVFRRLYAAVGFERLVRLTRLAVVSSVLDWAYDRFAANRLRFTGRCDAAGACAVHAAS